MRAMTQSPSTPGDRLTVGSRVVLRRRLDAPDPISGATLSDVVGTLVRVGSTAFVVDTRRGEVAVPRDAVTIAKVIPPRPSRRGAPHRALSVEDLQRVMIGAWPAMEVERLGDWTLRAARGFTQRGNSVVTGGDPGLPLEDAVDRVEAWYAMRGLPANLTLAGPVGFDPAADPLGAALARRGYVPRVPTTLTLTAATGGAALRGSTAGVELTSELSPDWFRAYTAYRAVDDVAARAILTGSPEQVFALRRDGAGQVIAIGRLALADGWGGIAAMWVAPELRGQGLATALLRALCSRAADTGARSVHLQVDADNDAALRLYRGLGFVDHHAYVNVRAPA